MNEPSIADHKHAVRARGHSVAVCRDQSHVSVAVTSLDQMTQDHGFGCRIDYGGRLVRKEHLRAGRERHRQPGTRRFTAGQLRRTRSASPGQTCHLKQRVDFVSIRLASQRHLQAHVALYGEVLEQVSRLHQHADVPRPQGRAHRFGSA
jgi:hypothetical protein